MVRALRVELGTEHGTVQRVAKQLGYGVESIRSWVAQADIDDGHVPGVSTTEAARVTALEQEIRELKRANEILKRAASFFGSMPKWSCPTGVRSFLRRHGVRWLVSDVRLRSGALTSVDVWLDRSLLATTIAPD
jgi:transposase-like protein